MEKANPKAAFTCVRAIKEFSRRGTHSERKESEHFAQVFPSRSHVGFAGAWKTPLAARRVKDGRRKAHCRQRIDNSDQLSAGGNSHAQKTTGQTRSRRGRDTGSKVRKRASFGLLARQKYRHLELCQIKDEKIRRGPANAGLSALNRSSQKERSCRRNNAPVRISTNGGSCLFVEKMHQKNRSEIKTRGLAREDGGGGCRVEGGTRPLLRRCNQALISPGKRWVKKSRQGQREKREEVAPRRGR